VPLEDGEMLKRVVIHLNDVLAVDFGVDVHVAVDLFLGEVDKAEGKDDRKA